MRSASAIIASLVLVAPAFAQGAEGQAVFDCLMKSAISFEPHQDNMRDLAFVLVETECIKERDAFLTANNMNHAEGLSAYQERMRSEMLAMIVASRANRLGIPRE